MILFLKKIKENPKLKKIAHWLMIPTNEARPRMWVSWFVNPLFHNKLEGSKIRSSTRMDVLPFNRFELGKRSIIESFTTINNGVGDVTIGDNTLVGISNVIIGPVTIGNNVITAQHVVMSGLNHEYSDPTVPIKNQKIKTAQIIVEDDCWIAANVTITAGTTIGKHSVVAGGAVVTKDVPPYSVVAGNPARVIKQYDFEIGEWISVKKN